MKNSKIIIIVSSLIIYFLFSTIGIQLVKIVDPIGYISNISDNIKEKALYDYIERKFYKDVDEEALTEGVFKGIVASLGDKYSEYYTPEEYALYTQNTTKEFGGIGATLTKDKDSGLVSISDIQKDSPSDKAGLKIGDIIISADGYLGKDLELTPFVEHIRGEVGSSVEILYKRDDKETIVSIQREIIHIPTVASELINDNIAYVSISSFAKDTANEFETQMDGLISEEIKDFIIDLRGNPGGFVDTCVRMLDYLLPEGTLVYMQDKAGRRKDYVSDEENYQDINIAILVNEQTASASEIFCGAIRDFDYGTIIGTTTVGKGVVQDVVSFSDGSGLKLTSSQYFTPKGVVINELGIVPDIELEYEYTGADNQPYNLELDNQVKKAVEILKSK